MSKPKRAVGRPKTSPEGHVPDLVVRGLTADDMTALDAEQARRLATLPAGVKLSRNALVIMILREALGVAGSKTSGEPQS